ncbi:MAG: MOSC N-terminal beta barrel domain-containing protein, partial [Solirubrobacterales bacterium]|nr:MOSC N-terminal beta barrel domain-containing protein [Solirubrobacterales bacterium]
MSATVTRLSITPVKGTRLRSVEQLRLDEGGVHENRRFFLIDERDGMVNATHLGALNALTSFYSPGERRLKLAFPDGRILEDDVRLGDQVTTRFYRQPTAARVVQGEWSEAISEYVGQPLRLVEAGPEGAVDRGPEGAVTLISRGSLKHLAERAQRPEVDGRR